MSYGKIVCVLIAANSSTNQNTTPRRQQIMGANKQQYNNYSLLTHVRFKFFEPGKKRVCKSNRTGLDVLNNLELRIAHL